MKSQQKVTNQIFLQINLCSSYFSVIFDNSFKDLNMLKALAFRLRENLEALSSDFHKVFSQLVFTMQIRKMDECYCIIVPCSFSCLVFCTSEIALHVSMLQHFGWLFGSNSRSKQTLIHLHFVQNGYKLVRKESEEELSLLRSHDVEEGNSPADGGHQEGDGEEVIRSTRDCIGEA